MDADGNKTGGRQKGTPNKATAEVRALACEYGPDAVRTLAALAGFLKDEAGQVLPGATSEAARVSAIGMLLDRAYGRALPSRTIRINLPDTSTVVGVNSALAAVVQAVAGGEITTGEASDLCSVLESQRRVIELTDLERRIAALEGQGAGRGPSPLPSPPASSGFQ